MGTSAERSSSNTEYFTRGDKIPGLQVCSLARGSLYRHASPNRSTEWTL